MNHIIILLSPNYDREIEATIVSICNVSLFTFKFNINNSINLKCVTISCDIHDKQLINQINLVPKLYDYFNVCLK